MSLKQIINRKKLLESGVINAPYTIPGEPMIYSIKYCPGKRMYGLNVFRNLQWKSMLKCFFASQYSTKIPVVLILRFYVTPPDKVTIERRHLVSEKLPATHSHELCEYVLSFIEMLHHVLINSYRQIVKLDLEKYYSANPRTVMQFMKWNDYVELQSTHPLHTEAKGVSPDGKRGHDVQPELKGDATDAALCGVSRSGAGPKASTTKRPRVRNSAVPNTGCAKQAGKKKKTAQLSSSQQAARRRQPG